MTPRDRSRFGGYPDETPEIEMDPSEQRTARCACGEKHFFLCDARVKGHFCDKPLCCLCAVKPGKDAEGRAIHWCRDHAKELAS